MIFVLAASTALNPSSAILSPAPAPVEPGLGAFDHPIGPAAHRRSHIDGFAAGFLKVVQGREDLLLRLFELLIDYLVEPRADREGEFREIGDQAAQDRRGCGDRGVEGIGGILEQAGGCRERFLARLRISFQQREPIPERADDCLVLLLGGLFLGLVERRADGRGRRVDLVVQPPEKGPRAFGLSKVFCGGSLSA